MEARHAAGVSVSLSDPTRTPWAQAVPEGVPAPLRLGACEAAAVSPADPVQRARQAHRFDPRQRACAGANGLRLVRDGEDSVAAPNEVSAEIRRRLSAAIGAERFRHAFGGGVQFVADGGSVRIQAPTRSAAALIERRFGPAIAAVVREVIGPGGAVRFDVVEEPPQIHEVPAQASHARAPRSPAPSPGSPANGVPARLHRLEEFVVGPSNRLAYNAVLELLEDRGSGHGAAATPLFLHGPCGVGKTHLLHGLAHAFRERHAATGAVVRVVSGEVFLNEFISAIRHGGGAGMTGQSRSAVGSGGVERFRRQYRRCDLLCIDDVHFLVSKQATQQELQHTFDQIMSSGSDRGRARIVLTCDQHPRGLKLGDGGFSAALVSRFMSGMVAEIAPPDAELRARAASVFAQRRGLKLEPGALALLVERTGGDPRGGPALCSIRDIEGLVTRIDALHRVESGHGDPVAAGLERSVSEALVARSLGEGAAAMRPGGLARPVRPIRAEEIIGQTCLALGVERSELGASTRHKRVVLARALITHLCRELTTMSFPEIARVLGRPNHSTVITAHQRLARQIESGEVFGIGPDGGGLTVGGLLKELLTALTSATRRTNSPST